LALSGGIGPFQSAPGGYDHEEDPRGCFDPEQPRADRFRPRNWPWGLLARHIVVDTVTGWRFRSDSGATPL
jgi:hypothetical protein